MDEIQLTILKDTYSLSQLKHRLRILKANLLRTFFGGPDQNETISPADFNWMKTLPEEFFKNFSKENVYKILSEIDDAASKLETLVLYLPFEPDEASLEQIGSFARKTFNKPALLLDIKLDPNLIAGTALSWKGFYKDYSLRSQMAVKKRELWESFRKFLR